MFIFFLVELVSKYLNSVCWQNFKDYYLHSLLSYAAGDIHNTNSVIIGGFLHSTVACIRGATKKKTVTFLQCPNHSAEGISCISCLFLQFYEVAVFIIVMLQKKQVYKLTNLPHSSYFNKWLSWDLKQVLALSSFHR